MWLFGFNLLLYLSAELRQNGMHLIVEFGCVVSFAHLIVVFSRLRDRGLSLRLLGKFGAVQ